MTLIMATQVAESFFRPAFKRRGYQTPELFPCTELTELTELTEITEIQLVVLSDAPTCPLP